MKYGIYYAYWEKEWGGQFVPYIKKCKRLGFDILEVACGAFYLENDSFFKELRAVAEDQGMILTGGYGPRPEHNLASRDEAAVEKAFAFYADMFRKMELAGIPTGRWIFTPPWTSRATPRAPLPGCSVWRIWPPITVSRSIWSR